MPPLITAKIVFTGICTFVGIGTPETAAVFPNAMHHDVYLAVSDDYTLEKVNGPPTDRVRTIPDPVSGKNYFYISLNDATTEMSGIDPCTAVDFEPDRVTGNQREPDSAAAMASMHWVPHLKEVWPTIFGNVHSSHADLTANRPAAGIVHSRFPLTCGHVAVTHVDHGIWKFQPTVMMNPPIEQAVAQEVTQTVTLPGRELFFTTKHVETGAPKSLFKVGFAQGNTRDFIKVLIANVPLVDLLPSPQPCLNPSMVCPMPDDPDPCNCVDEHFHHYYGVYPSPPSLSKQPVPYRVKNRKNKLVQALRAGGGNCGPTQYP